jgi:hypothetical protein
VKKENEKQSYERDKMSEMMIEREESETKERERERESNQIKSNYL